MRKICSILLIICLAVLLFAGCNRPADAEVSGTAGVSAAPTDSNAWCGTQTYHYETVQALREAVEQKENEVISAMEYVLIYPEEEKITDISVSFGGFYDIKYKEPYRCVSYNSEQKPENVSKNAERLEHSGVVYYKKPADRLSGAEEDYYEYSFAVGAQCVTVYCSEEWAQQVGMDYLLHLEKVNFYQITE